MSIRSQSQLWLERHYPLLLGIIAFMPLIIFRKVISLFFWFGDDFDLLGQIQKVGLWPWIAKPWVESYSPVFKFFWGSSVFVFHGSYFAMLTVLWLCHAATITLSGYILRRTGFGWKTTVPALIVVGLPWTNIETLCWSVQLSPMLANLFLFAAMLIHLRNQKGGLWYGYLAVVFCIAASALCYSRGVLTGMVLAAMNFVIVEDSPKTSASRLGLAAAYLLPSCAVSLIILTAATGNQQAVLAGQTDKFGEMLQFALWYFCLNPFYDLFELTSWGVHVTWVLGAIKVALIGGALWKSRGSQRGILMLLLLFDLGNAALLGLGRYHTGLRACVSSRYQYCALLTTIPFLAFWLGDLFERLPIRQRSRDFVAAGIAALIAVALMRGWPGALGPFVDWRGIQPRAILLSSEPLPLDYQTPGIPGLPPTIARDLIARYKLH